MPAGDYKLLVAMADDLKDELHRITAERGRTLSGFVRESLRRNIDYYKELAENGVLYKTRRSRLRSYSLAALAFCGAFTLYCVAYLVR
jgi:hypothetical protein